MRAMMPIQSFQFSRLKRYASYVPHYIILLAWTALSLLPLVWLIAESSKPANQALSFPINFIPTRFELFTNIETVFRVVPLLRYFANSLFIVLVLATTDILISTLTGYALSKFRFPGRNLVFYFILGTTMISFMVIVVPLYVLVRDLGWVDSYIGIMAPGFVSAFGCFFMRQYISGIPGEYLDAARIDGASEPSVLFRVIMPMCKPALATLAIFRFLWEWDSLFWPLIVTGNQNLRTIPLGLTIMVQQYGWSPNYSMVHILTACLLVLLPVLFVFLLLRRQFMSAMTMSGLKF